jgi:hypothetical protein
LSIEFDLPVLGPLLKSSIIIGGIQNAEQQFLLIPPGEHNQNWLYWLFSNWGPEEIEYSSLQEYFEDSLEQIQSP